MEGLENVMKNKKSNHTNFASNMEVLINLKNQIVHTNINPEDKCVTENKLTVFDAIQSWPTSLYLPNLPIRCWFTI